MKSESKYPGGRKPHPQRTMSVESKSRLGDIRPLPYLKKIHIILPNVMVDRLKIDAREHGHTTLSDFLRKIVVDSELTSLCDVNEYAPLVWGPAERKTMERTVVKGGRARTPVNTRPPVAGRKIIK